LFCGAGGESTGILAACEKHGIKADLLAINHWNVAIETHSKNHVHAKHLCESVQAVDPRSHVSGGRVNFLWASPECTHFSNARGGVPRSDQSRASAWLILKWLSDLYVDELAVENVKEFLDWGPLGANGKPLKSKRGETFAAWVKAVESLGYRVEWRIMNAADYGAPTTRKRLIVRASRRKKIVWPEPTHSSTTGLFKSKTWVPARNIIDWSIPGKSIFDRKKPLAPNTLKRIEAGIKKFWGALSDPFLIILRGTSTVRKISEPLPTVTCSGAHYGLVEPMILHQMSGMDCIPVSRPLPTVTCRSGHALIEPFLMKYYGNSIGAESVDLPLATITCNDRFALVEGVPHLLDIRLRMLQPHELAAAQSFPEWYQFAGKREDVVKQIGNAVPPLLAQAIAETVILN
jgi:DNA (cytosine-5)-methyltransferase 1